MGKILKSTEKEQGTKNGFLEKFIKFFIFLENFSEFFEKIFIRISKKKNKFQNTKNEDFYKNFIKTRTNYFPVFSFLKNFTKKQKTL